MSITTENHYNITIKEICDDNCINMHNRKISYKDVAINGDAKIFIQDNLRL